MAAIHGSGASRGRPPKDKGVGVGLYELQAPDAALGVQPHSTRRKDLDVAGTAHLVQKLRPHAITGVSQHALNCEILRRIPLSARFVLIGEASHGTEEFYAQRAEITQLLIQERGFHAVCCEADWPDMFRANAYVRGLGPDAHVGDALSEFTRFPTWMWRNTSFASFVDWLRVHNTAAVAAAVAPHVGTGDAEELVKGMSKLSGGSGTTPPRAAAAPPAGPEEEGVEGTGHSSHSGETAARAEAFMEAARHRTVGLYGMDVYSMHSSASAVVDALKGVDPDAAHDIAARYRCIDKYGADAQAYGMAVGVFRKPNCEQAALAALATARRAAVALRHEDGYAAEEQALQIEANAMVVAGAEEYYRSMFFRLGRDVTWNLRDSHFLDTVKLVEAHLAGRGIPEPRIVLWAHNSHVGDARATDMSWRRNEHNIGQLARAAWGRAATYTIGFSTHTGTVAAADEWDAPLRIKCVNPSLPGSIEGVMHEVGLPHFGMDLREGPVRDALQGVLLERAIGVIYRPDSERTSHYFDAFLPGQFDMLVHVDKSSALKPLDGDHPHLETHGDLPLTFPEAL